jgi:hypothetical protein
MWSKHPVLLIKKKDICVTFHADVTGPMLFFWWDSDHNVSIIQQQWLQLATCGNLHFLCSDLVDCASLSRISSFGTFSIKFGINITL